MKNRISVFTAVIILSVAVAFLVFPVLKQTISGQKEDSDKNVSLENKNEFPIINKTPSFQVISIEITGGNVFLLMKNNYKKSINGFYAAVGNEKDNVSYNIEFLYSGIRTEIPPQDTFTFPITLTDSLYTDGLTFEAVFFSDGTADGEPEFIRYVKDIREGEKFQLAKGVNSLKEYLSSANDKNPVELADLKTEFSSFAVRDNTKSTAYNSGLSSGRGRLVRDVEDMQKRQESTLQSDKQALLKLQSDLEKLIQKF
jgi:hypothetical protein